MIGRGLRLEPLRAPEIEPQEQRHRLALGNGRAVPTRSNDGRRPRLELCGSLGRNRAPVAEDTGTPLGNGLAWYDDSHWLHFPHAWAVTQPPVHVSICFCIAGRGVVPLRQLLTVCRGTPQTFAIPVVVYRLAFNH